MSHPRDEHGIALMAALLVMMVCSILVAATMSVATHTSQRSGLDRSRSAALHAAEAGIESELATLSANPGPCPIADDPETFLPDQTLPTASYIIRTPISCAAQSNAVIAATGFVPNAAHPVATMTVVAKVNRGQSAPASGGINGGYAFPDAIFTNGALTATAGSLSTFGVGGTVPSITANGAIAINDNLGQLDGPVSGWGNVSLTSVTVGGPIVGVDVTTSGAAVNVHGDVTATDDLNLSGSTTVNGNATFKNNNNSSGPTITGGNPSQSNVTLFQKLGQKRPMPLFNDLKSDINTVLTLGNPVPNPTCPGAGVGNFYDFSGACTYNPGVINQNVVVISHGGLLTVTVPQTAGGQLYIINDGGGVTITGNGSTLPVFVYASGTVTMNGGSFSGQIVAGAVTVASPTTMTFVQPPIPMPDLSFPSGFSSLSTTLFPATVAFEYQCPGATTC